MNIRSAIRSTILAAALSLLVGAVGEGRAHADIPPADSCSSPGQPCQNAGPGANEAGTCVPVTCVKTRPDGDGGLTTTPYDCNLCRVLDPIPGHGGSGGSAAGGSGGSATAGSGGSATAGSGGSATAGTAGSHTSTGKGGGMPDDPGGKSSSGCSIVATGGPTPIGWLLVGLGIVLARRRKTT